MNLSNLLNATACKFNLLENWIEVCDKQILLDAHKEETESQKKSKKVDFENRMMKINYIANKNKKSNDEQAKIQIACSVIETAAPDLIPTNMDQIDSLYKKFKKECQNTSTSVIGIRQYKKCILLTIRHLLKLSVPEIVKDQDYEISQSSPADEVNSKLSKSIFYYNQFQNNIRANIIF